MRALLDINVLVALLDGGHIHHDVTSQWLERRIDQGWASTPLTQAGCLRILSVPTYPRAQPLVAVVARLREATRTPFHQFWPDDVPLLDDPLVDAAALLSSRQVMDACLLAQAVRHEGVLVTLDRGVDLRLVRGAEPRHLAVI
jgi:hypothetical protein